MSVKKLFKAISAVMLLAIVVVALTNPKIVDYFKGALVLFVEGEPNITYQHVNLDQPSDFDNVTNDYISALDDAGIVIEPDDIFDTNVTIFKANKAISVPANSPFKLTVDAKTFDQGSDIIEVAAALIDSNVIAPENIFGQCDDKIIDPKLIIESCDSGLISLIAGIDLFRYFNLKNQDGLNSYDILFPPLGIDLSSVTNDLVVGFGSGGTNAIKEPANDSKGTTAAAAASLNIAGSSSGIKAGGIAFTNTIDINPELVDNSNYAIEFITENFGINTDGSLERSLVVVSTNSPITNKMLEEAKVITPVFANDVLGFTSYDVNADINVAKEKLDIVAGQNYNFAFATNLDSVDVKLRAVSKTMEFEVPFFEADMYQPDDIVGQTIEDNLVADEDGIVNLSWDGLCKYQNDGAIEDDCDLEKYNYIYIDFIDENGERIETFIIQIDFKLENGLIVDLDSPEVNGDFTKFPDVDLYGQSIDVINQDELKIRFEADAKIVSYATQRIWTESTIFNPVVNEDHQIDVISTFNEGDKYKFSDLENFTLNPNANDVELTFNQTCSYSNDENGTLNPIQDLCEQSGLDYAFVTLTDENGKIYDFFVSLEFIEEGLLSSKKILGPIQPILGKIMQGLTENSLEDEDLEVIIQIIPIKFVEEDPLEIQVVSGSDITETSDDLFEYIHAKTYFEDRVEVQDLKFEPGAASTIGQGFGGLHDFLKEECENPESSYPNLQSGCDDIAQGMTRHEAINFGADILSALGLDLEIYKLHSDQDRLKVHRDYFNQLSFKSNDGYREYYAFVLGSDFNDLIGIGTNFIIEFFGKVNLDFSLLFDFVNNFGFIGYGFTNEGMNDGNLVLPDGITNNRIDGFNSIADFTTFNDKNNEGTLIIMALDRLLLQSIYNTNAVNNDSNGSNTPNNAYFGFASTETTFLKSVTNIDEDTVYINYRDLPPVTTDTKKYTIRVLDEFNDPISDTLVISNVTDGTPLDSGELISLNAANDFIPGSDYTLEMLENGVPIESINFKGYNPVANIIDSVYLDSRNLKFNFNPGLFIDGDRTIVYKYSLDSDPYTDEPINVVSRNTIVNLDKDIEIGEHTLNIQYCDNYFGCYPDGQNLKGNVINSEYIFTASQSTPLMPRFYVIPLEFVEPPQDFYANLINPSLTPWDEYGTDQNMYITDDEVVINNGNPINFTIDTNSDFINYDVSIYARSRDLSTEEFYDNFASLDTGEIYKRNVDIIKLVGQQTANNNLEFSWDGQCNYEYRAVGLKGGTIDWMVLENPENECDETLNHYIRVRIQDTTDPTGKFVSYTFPVRFSADEPSIVCNLVTDWNESAYNPVVETLAIQSEATIGGLVLTQGMGYEYTMGIYNEENELVYEFPLEDAQFNDVWFHTNGNVNNTDQAQIGDFQDFIASGNYQVRFLVTNSDTKQSMCNDVIEFQVGEPSIDEVTPECPDTSSFPTYSKGDDYDVYEAEYANALSDFVKQTPAGLDCDAPPKTQKPGGSSTSSSTSNSRPSANSSGYCAAGTADFSDIEETDPMYPAVEFATTIGFTGKPDADCDPKKRIDLYAMFNRVEYAKIASLMVAQFQDLETDIAAIRWTTEDGPMYSDTNFSAADQSWQANHIKRATQIGIFRGYLGEKDARSGLVPFKAANQISYAEFIKVSFIALGLGDADDFNKKQSPWYGTVMQTAKDANLPSYERFKYAPTKTLTRGDAISILYEIKQLGMWPKKVKSVSFSD